MSRPAKFYFTPVKEIHGREPSQGNGQVSIDCRNGRMRFSRRAISIFAGKIIKIYADKSKKAIAWEVFENGSLSDLKETHLLKVYESPRTETRYGFKNIFIGIKSALKEIGMTSEQNLKETYNSLDIQEYQDKEMNKKFYYVILEK